MNKEQIGTPKEKVSTALELLCSIAVEEIKLSPKSLLMLTSLATARRALGQVKQHLGEK